MPENDKAKKRPPLGQRRTQQREVIREVVLGFGHPVSVEQILEIAVSRCVGLSQSTVYRTVRLLQKAGAIKRIVLSDGVARYEAAGLDHHHHFKCRQCGAVLDFEHCLFSWPEGARLPSGFVVESHAITLHGLCPDC